MKRFEHIPCDSLDAAASVLIKFDGKARAIAGGTDLLGVLKDAIHPVYPEAIVDLKPIDGLSDVEEVDNAVSIGAMIKLRDLACNPIIREKYGLLAKAAGSVASPQIRNMGTIAGNICQEPRCWYYRNPENTFHCARKLGDICHALNGDNRFHSVFGSMRVEFPPCTRACPVDTDIPGYLEFLREGKFDEAAALILDVNPMPAVTGRVCPHFCEQNCNREHFDEAVSIRAIERALGDHILAHHDRFIRAPSLETSQSIAIAGAGPSGLACAYFLRRSGHRVVVYDRMDKAGGMLRYGIPAFRLPKGIVDSFVSILEGMGIKFELGVEIGKDLSVSALLRNFDAVYLAGGAWASASLPLEGRENAIEGTEFLTSLNKGVRFTLGNKVLVIGGGNVAVDVAVAAKRLGAEEVVMACLEKKDEMPALAWEVEHALEEGIKLMTSWGPCRIILSSGIVAGIELIACTSVFDEEGRFSPKFDTNKRKIVGADSIILAVGQQPDDSLFASGVDRMRGFIRVDPETQATRIEGLYAGGDGVNGAGTVVEAIAAGRRAARSMNQYLGKDFAERKLIKRRMNRFDESCLDTSSRQEPEYRAARNRDLLGEDQSELSQSQLTKEVKRCFNCGCVAVCPSDLAPALVALDAGIVTGRRTIPAEVFFAAGPLSSSVLERGELISRIIIPARKNLRTDYLKFRIRNAIDFPIASVAVALEMEASKVIKARIVLGAAAPVPLRAREAERVLEGKAVGVREAEEAAQVAVGAANPLKKNVYKVEIIHALVKRAILSALNKHN